MDQIFLHSEIVNKTKFESLNCTLIHVRLIISQMMSAPRKVWISIDSDQRFEPDWNQKPIARLPHNRNGFIQLDAECDSHGIISYNNSPVIAVESLREHSNAKRYQSEDPLAEYYVVYCSDTAGKDTWVRDPLVIDGISLQGYWLCVNIDDSQTRNGDQALTWIYPWHTKRPRRGWKWIQKEVDSHAISCEFTIEIGDGNEDLECEFTLIGKEDENLKTFN